MSGKDTDAQLPPPRAGRREWLGLAVLALPTILLGLDMTVLHLAAPVLSADLAPSSSQLLWIVDVYGFVVAGLLITMGTVGDRIGRRRLLMIGATGFALASVLAAFSTSPELLIAARVLLGMAGPLIGGVLLEHFWWGSVFLIGVPPLLILLATARALLPEFRTPGAGRIDLASVALSTGAIVAVVYGLKEIAKDGPHHRLSVPVSLRAWARPVRSSGWRWESQWRAAWSLRSTAAR
ncbi:MFS transporter [Kribbella sp. VKM Ac-2568]|uniref:MFS transporter n=1 Tax=Kribbella sp. VKM Ac-2568 TaxID=2512219 RepID=UPI0010E29EDF|nr:MFS transporter [Kribbella sp. VKM Ac-2568]TCM48043.1 MFS transporter [Kribbella sp. VKM Ac-2568]